MWRVSAPCKATPVCDSVVRRSGLVCEACFGLELYQNICLENSFGYGLEQDPTYFLENIFFPIPERSHVSSRGRVNFRNARDISIAGVINFQYIFTSYRFAIT